MKKYLQIFGTVVLAIVTTLVGTKELDKVLAQSSAPCFESEIVLRGGNGAGSGTSVRRFTTATISIGTDVSYSDDSINGGILTINTNGLYAISYTDGNSTTGSSGVTNFIDLTLNDDEPNFSSSLCYEQGTITNSSGTVIQTCSNTVILSSGDIIRAFSGHNDALIGASARLSIVKIK